MEGMYFRINSQTLILLAAKENKESKNNINVYFM